MVDAPTTPFPFDHVIITFPDHFAAKAASEGPLQSLRHQYSRIIDATTDPYGARVGSGGGTVAALLCAAPTSSRVLILHAGGESSRCPTQMVLGKAWTLLPCDSSPYSKGGTTVIELWLRQCRALFRSATLPEGSVVVVASDTLLQLPVDEAPIDWSNTPSSAVLGLAVPAPFDTATNHGVYVLENKTVMKNTSCIVPCRAVWQKPSLQELQQHDCCCWSSSSSSSSLEPTATKSAWIDTGVVVFMPMAAAALYELARGALAACTKTGLDAMYKNSSCDASSDTIEAFSKQVALKVDLYTHLLQALTLEQNETEQQHRRQSYCSQHQDLSPHVAKAILDALGTCPLHILAVPNGSFLHLGTTRELHDFVIQGSSATCRDSSSEEKRTQRQVLNESFGRDLCLQRRLHTFTKLNVKNDNDDCYPVHATCVIYHSILTSNHPESRIGASSVVEHCCLDIKDDDYHQQCLLSIGNDCLVSGMRGGFDSFCLPDGMFVQMLPLQGNNNSESFVYMVLGIDDDVKGKKNLYLRPIQEFLEWAGLSETNVWDDGTIPQTLWTARLHPVVGTRDGGLSFDRVFSWLSLFCKDEERGDSSLQRWKDSKRLSMAEIRELADSSAEFLFREALATRRVAARKLENCREIERVVFDRLNTQVDLRCFVADYALTGCVADLCQVVKVFDAVVGDALEQKRYDVCGRACMIMSGLFYELTGLVQSGLPDPADMIVAGWGPTLTLLLAQFNVSVFTSPSVSALGALGIHALGVLAKQAAVAMTMKCVCDSTDEGMYFPFNSDPQYDEWIIATAPVRIDLAGGWSDTPPVCCEFGSVVTGAAVTVDGKMPLSCRCRLVTGGRGILLRSELRSIESGELLSHKEISLTSIRQLIHFQDPHSDCALLQCAMVCLGLTNHHDIARGSDDTNFLQAAVNALCRSKGDVRVELVASSLLPQGSGLGTSSILGGCILAAIGKCVGKDFMKDCPSAAKLYSDDIISAVLLLEQLLTTGGGFQDQVNGLVGGIKCVRCRPCTFPIKLSIEKINFTSAFREQFNSRVVLAFTGKTRLAKNILHNVLNRWSKRTPEIVDVLHKLVSGAEKAQEQVETGDLGSLALTFNEYWELKKIMAGTESGVEPQWMQALTSELKQGNVIVGASLCGAGGGGFLALILSDSASMETLHQGLESSELDLCDFALHYCGLSDEGLVVRSLPESKPMEFFDLEWVTAKKPN
jgi:galactokinase/mevalonate kinase-like predicted kinase